MPSSFCLLNRRLDASTGFPLICVRQFPTASKFSNCVKAFVGDIAQFDLPVETEDERYTSVEAEQLLKTDRALGLRRRINKEMIDSTAAILIAERWLSRN